MYVLLSPWLGCIPLLVQLIYNQDVAGESNQPQDRFNHWILSEADKETRASAAQALHNLVYNSSDDRKVKREIRVLKLLELIRDYADRLRDAITRRLEDQQEFDHRHPLLEEGLFSISLFWPSERIVADSNV